jgi:hypothetical protein
VAGCTRWRIARRDDARPGGTLRAEDFGKSGTKRTANLSKMAHLLPRRAVFVRFLAHLSPRRANIYVFLAHLLHRRAKNRFFRHGARQFLNLGLRL